MATSGPSVLAVLVATDGASWLPEVLAGLESQTYPNLSVIAVDNGSTDDSRQILLSRLPARRVLVAERDLGFPGAVSMALDAVPGGDLVLLVHDDVVLHPEALAHMVEAISRDQRLAIVGPKLLDWDDPRRLQQVGWSVDTTGRAHYGIDQDELDQGQRDRPRRPLVVSTAGMLLRRAAFDQLGRFDRRYHVFRDDLDLCWRAWMAGWEVEVVPRAAARHRRAAADYHRLGQSAFLGPRYFAERNTLATLLKNHAGSRLLWIVPLFFLVGIAKIFGFLATRRVGDAGQTVRAWAWNLLHLRTTLRLRSQAQRLRRRTDSELKGLFERIGPRLRAYAEAVADRLTGGDLRVGAEFEEDSDPATVTSRLLESLRRHPVGWTAGVLVVVGLAVSLEMLLSAGLLRGGTLSPFPSSGWTFLRDYASSWHEGAAVGTAASPSPAQAILGFLQLASLNSEWLAPRLLVLGALPIAWLLSLRAIRPLAPSRGPRVAAATLYVLSPTALAALRTGQIGAIVAFIGLPALAGALFSAVRLEGRPTSTWRAVAAAILVAAVVIAFEPATALGIMAAVLAVGLWVWVRSEGARRLATLLRLAVFVAGTLAVLFPWSVTFFRPDSPVLGGAAPPGAQTAPFWQWLLQAPEQAGFAGIVAGAGVVIAGVFGLLVAARRQGGAVLWLWAVAIVGAVGATVASRAGLSSWMWPGVPLLLTSGALAALFAVGLRSAAVALKAHDFGWRHVGAILMVAGAIVGSAASVLSLALDGWSSYRFDGGSLPLSIRTKAADGPAFRVLVVGQRDGQVVWDVEAGQGARMTAYGTQPPRRFVDSVQAGIEDVISGADPAATSRLRLLNIRFVVVPPEGLTAELDRALASQSDLEPQPVADGRIYEVAGWMPRVSFVPRAAVDQIARTGLPPAQLEETAFQRTGYSSYAGEVPGAGSILLAESEERFWVASQPGGEELAAAPVGGVTRIDVTEAGTYEVVHGASTRRRGALTLEVLAVLLVVSVMLRPPSSWVDERGA